MRNRSLLLGVVLVLVLALPAFATPYIFTSFDYPGAIGTNASGINASGQIVGSYGDSSFQSHGFLKDGATYTSFDYPGDIGTRHGSFILKDIPASLYRGPTRIFQFTQGFC
jgi:probable HAF family extracellular repeat protein